MRENIQVYEVRKGVYEVKIIVDRKDFMNNWFDVLKAAAKILWREVVYFESHN